MKAWCIKNGMILLPFTIRGTRRDTIDEFLLSRESWGDDKSWVQLKRLGYSIVKVDVKEPQ